MKKEYLTFLLMFLMAFLVINSVGNAKSVSLIENEEQIVPYYKKLDGQNISYYVMNPDPVFGSTAILIEKNGKGFLVDTQFSKDDAEKILQLAKEKNIDIQTIYISHGDPDYYFGTTFIKEVFPNAEIFSTESTRQHIQETYQNKLLVWADVLKEKAPKEVILPTIIEKEILFGGEHFQIRGKDPHKTFLYNASDNIILGGVLVATDSHLFMADTKTIKTQKQWIDSLDDLKKIKATTVIPGHFGEGNDFSPENVDFTKQYIKDFIKAEKTSDSSEEIIKKMTEKYPNLAEGSLIMSAKVVTGEEEWN